MITIVGVGVCLITIVGVGVSFITIVGVGVSLITIVGVFLITIVGVGVSLITIVGDGEGVGDSEGDGEGDGEREGEGDGDGEGDGVGDGDGTIGTKEILLLATAPHTTKVTINIVTTLETRHNFCNCFCFFRAISFCSIILRPFDHFSLLASTPTSGAPSARQNASESSA